MDLARLVDLCAERLDLNVEYDRTQLIGSVTLRLGEPVTDQELWELTNHVLASRGFTTVRTREDGFLSVVKIAAAPTLGRLEDPARGWFLPGFLTVATQVKHVSPKDAVEALKTVLTGPSASVTALGSSRLLLLTDARPRVLQALELLALLDVPAKDVVVESRAVLHVLANDAAAAANEIMQTREGMDGQKARGRAVALPDGSGLMLVAPLDEADAWRDVVRQLDQGEGVRSLTYSPRYFPVKDVAALISSVVDEPLKKAASEPTFRLVADELTGTLIVTGTASQHAIVAGIVERLDSVPPRARRQIRAFPIRNRGVSEVVALIQQLVDAELFEPAPDEPPPAAPPAQRSVREIKPEESAPPAPQDAKGEKRGGAGTPPGDSGEGPPLTLAADEGTNTLLAVGEPRFLTQLADLVLQLDVRQPQVMLEVMVVSMTTGETTDLGVELRRLAANGATQALVSSLFDLGDVPDPLALDSTTGPGFSGMVLSPGEFSTLLRALATVSEGRSLNLPKVLVNNNQQATFHSVLQQPFLSTNASDTVATTSFGGTQDAGTSVSVRPQIAEGDHLVLDYQISLSEFIGDST
ncbi:MAG: hypothetical protein HY812_19095, partial [Planctomycetes bacterium]|nr:hypothetical protein [Planctomycetota bacterium]